jgi:ABC-type Mn2+/Zn2+ transport system ATPase subunit
VTGDGHGVMLVVEHLTVEYNGMRALDDVTFSVAEGARVAVVGPNGAGKSTLFKAMVGLLPPSSGRVLFHGMESRHHCDCLAYVPQREAVDWDFPVTVLDVVMMGRYGRLGWVRRPGSHDRDVVRTSMDRMGIAGLANRAIRELSGGQQQRVFLARALVQESHVILLDEPFTGVDMSTQQATLELLDELRSQAITVLIATHDLGMASERFDQVLLLNRRVVRFGIPAEVFSPSFLAEAFGGRLLVLPGGLAAVEQCGPNDDGGHKTC